MTNQHTTPSAAARLASKTRIDERGCHVWLGAMSSGGYGNLRVGGRVRRAHKVAWELANGPVPDGLQIDHLCRNRACVNPDHLELVTNRENTIRGTSGDVSKARGESRTHCRNGHVRTDENTRTTTNARGWAVRVCRVCDRSRKSVAACSVTRSEAV